MHWWCIEAWGLLKATFQEPIEIYWSTLFFRCRLMGSRIDYLLSFACPKESSKEKGSRFWCGAFPPPTVTRPKSAMATELYRTLSPAYLARRYEVFLLNTPCRVGQPNYIMSELRWKILNVIMETPSAFPPQNEGLLANAKARRDSCIPSPHG